MVYDIVVTSSVFLNVPVNTIPCIAWGIACYRYSIMFSNTEKILSSDVLLNCNPKSDIYGDKSIALLALFATTVFVVPLMAETTQYL